MDGAVKTAELVDQADILGLCPRPFPSLPNLVDNFDRQMPPVGNAFREFRISLLQRLLDIGLLLRRKILLVRKQGGIVAGGYVIRAHAKQIVKSGQIQLSREDANGTGDGVRIGNNFLCGSSDPIASSGRPPRRRTSTTTTGSQPAAELHLTANHLAANH